MRTLKTHLAINEPGGTFVKTACGRVLLAADMGRQRPPHGFSLVLRSQRCASCEGAYPRWAALAARHAMPWQEKIDGVHNG
jgi:hypothetical protein